MNVITVERFTDSRYSRPRYRLRHSERKTYLRDGHTEGSYKFKRDAELRADELNMGHFAALAKRDGRYSFRCEAFSSYPKTPLGQRYAVTFCGERIGTAPNMRRAYQLAGEHIADRRGVARDNPNRRAFELDVIARHFTIAAQWADSEEGTRPQISGDAQACALRFAAAFTAAHSELCAAAMDADGYGSHPDAGSPAAAFGHDLYLTAAGHGVGFADRAELGDAGEALAEVIRTEWRRWHVETYQARGWLYISAPNISGGDA